jgi:ATP-dependent Clp protease adaptor protein ClpS
MIELVKPQQRTQSATGEWQPRLQDWHLPSIRAVGTDDDEAHDADVLTSPPELQRPPLYAVVLFNDDYTPMEFVIEVLQQYFGLDLDRATEVMLTVHYRGKGVAGIYPRDIAETKAQQVNNYARSQGHPLLCQIEPQPQ